MKTTITLKLFFSSYIILSSFSNFIHPIYISSMKRSLKISCDEIT